MINRTAPQPRLVSLFGEKGARWLMSRAGQKSLITGDWGSWGVGSIQSFTAYGTYGGNIDYATEAGRLDHNSIVMIACQWIMRNGVASRPRVMERSGEGDPVELPNHPLAKLLEKPNAWYSGRLLRQSTLLSLSLDGNGYWVKRRNGLGTPLELWFEPYWTIRPVWDNSDSDRFIDHYQIFRKGRWLTEPADRLTVEDVIHFRFGMDPDNMRKGISPLKTALREIYTDNQASRYTSAMLRNNGVPGVVYSPTSNEVSLSKDDALEIKASHQTNFTGDHAGEAMVLGYAMKVEQFAFNPEQMNLSHLRDKPEERIPALLGLNPVVLGLGVGLAQSSYNNITEAGVDAYENNILPAEMVFADELRSQLLPDFGNSATQYVDFDRSSIRLLQDDENAKATRWATLYEKRVITRAEARAPFGLPAKPDVEDEKQQDPTARQLQVRLASSVGIFTMNEARAAFGLPPLEGGDVPVPVYLETLGVSEPEPEPTTPPFGGQNGNGQDREEELDETEELVGARR